MQTTSEPGLRIVLATLALIALGATAFLSVTIFVLAGWDDRGLLWLFALPGVLLVAALAAAARMLRPPRA